MKTKPVSNCFVWQGVRCIRLSERTKICKSEICCFPLMGQARFHFILPDWRLRFRDTESDLANSQLLSCKLFSWTGNPNKSIGIWSVLDGVKISLSQNLTIVSLNLYQIRKDMANNTDMSGVDKLVGNALLSKVGTLINTNKMPF